MTGKEIILYALEREKDDQKIYSEYMNHTDNLGLQHLLKSLLDQEKEHEKKLKELSESPALIEVMFTRSLEKYSPEIAFSADMSVNDFLNLIISREELAALFYSDVSADAGNEDLSFLFTSLAFDEERHKGWAVNRYELEMLSY